MSMHNDPMHPGEFGKRPAHLKRQRRLPRLPYAYIFAALAALATIGVLRFAGVR